MSKKLKDDSWINLFPTNENKKVIAVCKVVSESEIDSVIKKQKAQIKTTKKKKSS